MKLTKRSEPRQEPLLMVKVRSEVTLWKAGLKSLTEAVSVTMATLVWKTRKDMDTLGFIFEKKPSIKDTRPKYNDKLCQPVPGHPEQLETECEGILLENTLYKNT